jgi:hypothetical protein
MPTALSLVELGGRDNWAKDQCGPAVRPPSCEKTDLHF